MNTKTERIKRIKALITQFKKERKYYKVDQLKCLLKKAKRI